MSSTLHWCSVGFPSLLIEEWEDGFAIFHPDSGKTHFLNPLGMQVLAGLHQAGKEGITEQEISQRLANWLQVAPNETLTESVVSSLQRFAELGLAIRIEKDASRAH